MTARKFCAKDEKYTNVFAMATVVTLQLSFNTYGLDSLLIAGV